MFEVRTEHVLVESDGMTGAADSSTQLDVLDRRTPVPFIEAAQLIEDCSSHGATPRPERPALLPGMLMSEVVQQVPIVRDERASGWGRVIRAEQGGQRRIGLERRDHPGNHVGRDDHVGVHEQDDLGGRGPHAVVAGGGRSPGHVSRDDGRPARAGDLCGAIGRPVIDHDHLDVIASTRPHRVETARDHLSSVAGRCDDSHLHGTEAG